MKKIKMIIATLGIFSFSTTVPLFSAGGGGDDEGEGGCYVVVQGHVIFDGNGKAQGCINGASGCTYQVQVDCP